MDAPESKPSWSFASILGALFVVAAIFAVVILVSRYTGTSVGTALATDAAPTEVDGKSGTTTPSGVSGTTTSVQFWMYIKDWDYRFGQKKMVLDISDPTNPGIVAPGISLHPTDNTLDIEISVHSNGSNTETTNTGHGESQVVAVENVPLQSWFAVSVTIFQRNVDVYINGRLVKSAVLAGIPKPANGNLTIGGGGGFSGSVCTVHATSKQLMPAEAAAFYTAGTACSGSGSSSVSSQLNNLTLFGYTFIFGVKDSKGKTVFDVSNSGGSS